MHNSTSAVVAPQAPVVDPQTRVHQRSDSADIQPAAKRVRVKGYVYPESAEEENEQLAAAIEVSKLLDQSTSVGPTSPPNARTSGWSSGSMFAYGSPSSGSSSGALSGASTSSVSTADSLDARSRYRWNPTILSQVRSTYSGTRSPSPVSSSDGYEKTATPQANQKTEKKKGIKEEHIEVGHIKDHIDLTGDD